MAAATGATVLPVVLGVPFSDWPPAAIGGTAMTDQFMAPNGDLKVFVDMSNHQADFHTKLQKELLPRLLASSGRAGPNQNAGQAVSSAELTHAEIVKNDSAAGKTTPVAPRASRPGKKAPKSRVAPAADDIAAPADVDVASRGACSVCGQPVLFTQARESNADGTYRHMDCTPGV